MVDPYIRINTRPSSDFPKPQRQVRFLIIARRITLVEAVLGAELCRPDAEEAPGDIINVAGVRKRVPIRCLVPEITLSYPVPPNPRTQILNAAIELQDRSAEARYL